MDFVQQHYSITLITRQQRGFALFLMVDWGCPKSTTTFFISPLGAPNKLRRV
jgi:hypothetical protein